jgi:hypothetical protein
MSALTVIRGGLIGLLAVVIPAAALGVTEVFILQGVGPFLGLLGITYVMVGGLAWTCVRIAHFPPRLAIFLTTFPFGILLLMTLTALAASNPGGFFICLVQLALAVLVAWAATRQVGRPGAGSRDW